MILIEYGTTNLVALTLAEKSSTATPTYLFSFTNDFSGEDIVFTAPDTSLWPSRYNSFEITSVTDQVDVDLQDGKILMEAEGYWTYAVYEMATPSTDPGDAVGLVETGKVLLRKTACAVPEYDPEADIVPVYDPACD